MSIFHGEKGMAGRRILWGAAVLICLLAAVLGGCAAENKRPADGRIVVWADSGLQKRLEPLASRFAQQDGVRVQFRFAATDALEQAAASGTDADLLIFSGETPMKTLYQDKTVDNYNLFVFRDAETQVFSIAKPMAAHNYWYTQKFADLVTGADTRAVSGSNPNL